MVSSIFSDMIQLKSASTTRASLPCMPLTEITNWEKFVDRVSAYHYYPSWLFPANPGAPPLAHICRNIHQRLLVWSQWWLQTINSINLVSWYHPASTCICHSSDGYLSLIWYVPDRSVVWHVIMLMWRLVGQGKEICHAIRCDVQLTCLLCYS